MKGYLDSIDQKRIQGWAFSPQRPTTPVAVTVLVGGISVASGTANRFRPDVAEEIGCSGYQGFDIPLPETIGIEDLMHLTVELEDGVERKSLPYRCENLAGNEAQALSAWREVARYLSRDQITEVAVVGDLPHTLAQALGESGIQNVARFVAERVDDPPANRSGHSGHSGQRTYPAVLVSAVDGLHHGTMPEFELASELTGPEGFIFLNCYLAKQDTYCREMNFFVMTRGGSQTGVYPTIQGLQDILLRDYSVRFLHPSANTSEDIASYIFLCTRKRPSILVIAGPSGTGKSTLAKELFGDVDQYINLDLLISHLKEQARLGLLPHEQLVSL